MKPKLDCLTYAWGRRGGFGQNEPRINAGASRARAMMAAMKTIKLMMAKMIMIMILITIAMVTPTRVMRIAVATTTMMLWKGGDAGADGDDREVRR